MDLFATLKDDRADKALDRLAAMVALFDAEDAAEQTEALDRAMAYCELEWGGYGAGLEALAERIRRRGGNVAEVERLVAEGTEPGRIIRERRRASQEQSQPLPTTVLAARAEHAAWKQRRLAGEPLSEAQLERLATVEGLWRKDLRATSVDDMTARLQYWAERAGEGDHGYGALLDDLAAVAASLSARSPSVTTKDRARRLKTENPDWSLARIGKQLGISRQAVHKHLKGFIPPA